MPALRQRAMKVAFLLCTRNDAGQALSPSSTPSPLALAAVDVGYRLTASVSARRSRTAVAPLERLKILQQVRDSLLFQPSRLLRH